MPDFNEGFDFFPLFGLPFLFIGIGMLLSPYFNYLRAQRIVYVITNQRAFELYCGRWKKVKTYVAGDIGSIERTERPDGSGNLFFSKEIHRTKNGTREVKVGFTGVEEVKKVEVYLNSLKASRG